MQDDPTYYDVVVDVRDFLVERADAARAAGVADVWLDPGIGFGKSLAHNLDLLANLDVLVATGYPVLVGTSRKAMLGTLAARADGPGAPVPRRATGSRARSPPRCGRCGAGRRWCVCTTWRRPCGRAPPSRPPRLRRREDDKET